MSKLKLWPTTSQVCTKIRYTQWVLGIIILSTSISLYSAERIESDNYIVLNSAPSDSNEITLYCWLGSQSCYVFERALSQWSTENAIPLIHKPLIKRPHWRRLAKARLVAQIMDVENELVELLNQHLHVAKLSIDSDEALFALLEDSQISASRFANIYYAAETNMAINAIQDEANQNQVRGIPTIVINNQWLLDASMHKTSRDFIRVLNDLLGTTNVND